MLEVSWIEFLIRGIPEAFVTIWAIYIISKQPINKSKYIICSLSSAVVTFLVRFLPVHLGIHTIISSVFMVCALIIVGIPLLKSIYGVIITILLLLIGEFVNMILLTILKVDINSVFKSDFVKFILSLPSLISLIISILIIRFLINRKKGVKGECN